MYFVILKSFLDWVGQDSSCHAFKDGFYSSLFPQRMEEPRWLRVCLKYPFLVKMDFPLDVGFPIIIEGLNVLCLGYWVLNWKHFKQACSGVLQSMRIFNSIKAAVYWGNDPVFILVWSRAVPHKNNLLEDSSDTNWVMWVTTMLFQMVCS